MILLVNQHSVPLFIDVANSFASSGNDVRLFTGFVETGRIPLSPSVQKVNSIRYNRRTTLSRFITWILFTIHYFFYLCFCRKPSVVVVVTNPPLAPFITSLVARWRNIPFYIVVFDLYPEVLQQTGMVREGGWLYRIAQHSNRQVFEKANGIITLSDSMKNAVSKYVHQSKIKVIFNWADVDYIKPSDKSSNAFVFKHQLNSKLVVMYAGNMGLTHDLESVIEAAALLRDRNDITFVFIGDGAKRKKLNDISMKSALSNVLFLPYQDATTFPLVIASADIGIVTLGTGAEGISVPSKTYVNMAAGLAIIAISPPNSELNRIVEDFSVGHVVSPGESEKIARYVRQLADNPTELEQLKLRSRAASMNFTSANAMQYVSYVLGR